MAICQFLYPVTGGVTIERPAKNIAVKNGNGKITCAKLYSCLRMPVVIAIGMNSVKTKIFDSYEAPNNSLCSSCAFIYPSSYEIRIWHLQTVG